jgi:cytochrome c553
LAQIVYRAGALCLRFSDVKQLALRYTKFVNFFTRIDTCATKLQLKKLKATEKLADELGRSSQAICARCHHATAALAAARNNSYAFELN